jgi:hypothetical protein
MRIIKRLKYNYECQKDLNFIVNVADPWHFGSDPDPYYWLTDPDPTPDHGIFVSDLQDDTKKYLFWSFFAYYFWSYIYMILQR